MSRGPASKAKGSRDTELLTALATPVRKKPGYPCTVARILHAVSPEVRAKIEEIISEIRSARDEKRDTPHTCTWLADTLSASGHYVKPLTMQKHVSRRCACD